VATNLTTSIEASSVGASSVEALVSSPSSTRSCCFVKLGAPPCAGSTDRLNSRSASSADSLSSSSPIASSALTPRLRCFKAFGVFPRDRQKSP